MPKNQLSFLQIFFIAINAIIRITLPLYLFINPIIGSLLALTTDLIDHEPLVRLLKVPRRIYQLQDKYLDQYWYLLIIIYVYFSKVPALPATIIYITFLYRIIGQALFIFKKNELYFLVFPNLMEPFFWLYILSPNSFQNHKTLLNWTFIIVALKLYQEYFIHISKSSLLNNLLKIWSKNNSK